MMDTARLEKCKKLQEMKVTAHAHTVCKGVERNLNKHLVSIWNTKLEQEFQRLVDGSYLPVKGSECSQLVGWLQCPAAVKTQFEDAQLAYYKWTGNEEELIDSRNVKGFHAIARQTSADASSGTLPALVPASPVSKNEVLPKAKVCDEVNVYEPLPTNYTNEVLSGGVVSSLSNSKLQTVGQSSEGEVEGSSARVDVVESLGDCSDPADTVCDQTFGDDLVPLDQMTGSTVSESKHLAGQLGTPDDVLTHKMESNGSSLCTEHDRSGLAPVFGMEPRDFIQWLRVGEGWGIHSEDGHRLDSDTIQAMLKHNFSPPQERIV